VQQDGVVTADGTLRPVDTIILGTGFKVWDSPTAQRIVGRDGRTLADAWARGGPQAYVGTVVAGFPNMFFLVGPNTGLGNNSMINIIEAQLAFLLEALRGMDAAGAASLEVRRQVQDRYNARIQERMQGTVWTDGGCRSWYLSADGTNHTLWPSFSDAFKKRLARFDPADFELVRPRSGASAQPASSGS
jgi:cation diffusion facilitator CzcD-associated flavoprotein CzcO